MLHWFFGLLLFLQLVAITIVDVKTYRIPNYLNVMLAVTGFIYAILLLQQSPWILLLSAAFTYLLFYSFCYAYQRIRGISGLGMGDVKFITASVMWVGLAALPWLILLASSIALISLAVRRVIWGTSLNNKLAFGPYLAVSLLIIWLFSDTFTLYLQELCNGC